VHAFVTAKCGSMSAEWDGPLLHLGGRDCASTTGIYAGYGLDAPARAVPCRADAQLHADFEDGCPVIARERRVLSADLRGPGRSQHDPNWQQLPPRDVPRPISPLLLADAGTPRVVLLGTSLGGLLSMLLAATAPTHVAGVISNDIGPEVAATVSRASQVMSGEHTGVELEGSRREARSTYGLALPGLSV
jgi:pimeloyl-ACP methyl ester carboxylesterase